MSRDMSSIDCAFEKIEETILPSLSIVLDMLLDAGSLNRPGVDSEVHAAQLRAAAGQLQILAGQMASIPPQAGQPYVRASRA